VSKLFLTLCCLLLVLAGCSSGGGSATVEVRDDFRTGSQGLQLEFVRNIPPDEVFENSLITIGVNLHNKGAYDIDGGLLVLNYDNDYISLDSADSLRFDLEGKSQYTRDGEERPFFFEGSTNNLDQESQRREIPLSATACYHYASILSENVCLTLPYDTSQEKGLETCQSKPSLSFSGQGAPVRISKVDVSVFASELTQSTKVAFDITFTHSGKGLLAPEQTYDSICTSRSGSANVDEITLVSALLSDTIMSCNKQSFSLKENSAKIRCTAEGISSYLLPYEAPLFIELAYGYVETMATSISLVN
jgi:hypothetical protein